MSQALSPTDSTARRAGSVMRSSSTCSWQDRGLNAARAHSSAQTSIAYTPQLERALEEQTRACALALNLLELALIDRSDVNAVLKSSIRARRATRQLALERARSALATVYARDHDS